MNFFQRNRAQLAERGIDPARLPPGQYSTDRFPVLHVGSVPDYGDLAGWDFELTGLVRQPVTLSWQDVLELPATEITTDIHCVTKWSKFDTGWKGVAFDDVMVLVDVDPRASHVMLHGEFGYTTNLPLADVVGRGEDGNPKAMLAYEYGGVPLEPEHGYPLRFLCPHLYFWKSCKWLRAVEFMLGDRPGFWEQNGYHMYGDPFREQRYTDD